MAHHPIVPPPISGANSAFAAFTFDKRFPHIIEEIKTNHPLETEQKRGLDKLAYEIEAGTLNPSPSDFDAEDWPFWKKFVSTHAGRGYRDIPFYDAEAYIYFRIISIVGFKQVNIDPFEKLKTAGLESSMEFISHLADRQSLELTQFDDEFLQFLLFNCLWGNSADMSQLERGDYLERDASKRGRLVIDDTLAIVSLLRDTSKTTIDLIADNAGVELITDLLLIDYLLATHAKQRITLHLKHYPIFVSDATIADVWKHLLHLEQSGSKELISFAGRLRQYIQEEKLALKSHPFWNSPLHFSQIPTALTGYLQRDTILIFKGDANYRRLFEDRKWPKSTPVHHVMDYFESPCIAIRTLKSEIVVGLEEEHGNALAREDPNWLTNGRYGLLMLQKQHQL